MTKKKSVKKNKKTNSDKIKLLNEKIDLVSAELEISKDKNVRLLAEFDNFKRRTNQTISDKEKYEGIDFIKEIYTKGLYRRSPMGARVALTPILY